MMNRGHASLAAWGLQHIEIQENAITLDIGGGGANIKKLLKKKPPRQGDGD